MSHYKPYPAYKDSGIEWIGKVPAHWDISPFFTVAKELSRSNKGMIESKVLSLSYGRVIPKQESENLGLVPESYETYQIVEPGEIVFRFTDLQNDKNSLRSAQVRERGIITSAYLAAKAFDIDETYLAWLMRAYDHCKVFYALGGGLRQSLKYSDVKRLPVVIPPLKEQCRSVILIDRETARIDVLIAKKIEFIELLAKKRKALITHAVTKGIDPNAMMKDSGVEWIGEVPEHWCTGILKRFIVFQRGHDLPSESRAVGSVPVVSSGGYSGTHNVAVAKAPGIVTGRYGSLGQFTFVQEDYWPLNTALYSIELYDNAPRFIWYLLQHISSLFLLYSAKAAVPGIDRNDIHEICVAAPLRDEQEQIAEYLDKQLERIDAIMAKTKLSIDLLKKRRSALITAAVTGQIDLRESA